MGPENHKSIFNQNISITSKSVKEEAVETVEITVVNKNSN